jgi:2',3'-cyclic-nucleotide 2'-phosphodiesterase (5'-nucleotidase family)
LPIQLLALLPGKGILPFFMKRFLPVIIIFLVSVLSCGPRHYAPVQLSVYNYGLDGSRQGESNDMKAMLKPYTDSVNKSMNLVLGTLEVQLTKSWPSCSLGNFMCDAYKEVASRKFGKKVDVAAMNVGGIRLLTMEPGPISKGKIFELMPFDNLLVLIELEGTQMQAFLDHLASRGGWPLAGAVFTIENKKATSVLIDGKPLDPNAKYVLATSDYVANGGDESNVLKGLQQMNIGYLQRDAIIEYVMEHKTIGMPEGNRLINKGQ